MGIDIFLNFQGKKFLLEGFPPGTNFEPIFLVGTIRAVYSVREHTGQIEVHYILTNSQRVTIVMIKR